MSSTEICYQPFVQYLSVILCQSFFTLLPDDFMVSTSVEDNQDDTPSEQKQKDFADAFPEEVYQHEEEEHSNSIGNIDLDLDEK